MAETTYHIPAMLVPTIDGLNIHKGGIYVDVTLGGGGHSREILRRLGAMSDSLADASQEANCSKKQLYSFDQDMDAYQNKIDDVRWQFVRGNFRYLSNFMDYYGVDAIDGLIADLGVSFHHFDEAERGFSFRFDGPLDMRMNQKGGQTAADIINTYAEQRLANVLYLYGELKNSRALAKKLVQMRTKEAIKTTGQLASLTGDKKELTKVFQALRIEVNDELGALREMLMAAKDLLRPGGRIAVLTYHSLEDRIVKNFLRSGNLEGETEKDFYGNILTPFKVIEKGRMAGEDEVERNPRARSAKLRVAEKI